MSDLQERLKTIENLIQLSQLGAIPLSDGAAVTPTSNPPSGAPQGFASSTNTRLAASQYQTVPPTPASLRGPQSVGRLFSEPERSNAIDGMAITVSEGVQSAFFGESPIATMIATSVHDLQGPSSNAAFLRQIQNLAQNLQVPSLVDCINHGAVTITRPSPHGSKNDADLTKDVNELVLPPQRFLEALIDIYFSHAALFFPYVHEATFRATYVELKASQLKSARRTWLALLNMVLAIASKLSQSPSDTNPEPETDESIYYKRAVKLINNYVFCATSVEMGEPNYLFILVLISNNHLCSAVFVTNGLASTKYSRLNKDLVCPRHGSTSGRFPGFPFGSCYRRF